MRIIMLYVPSSSGKTTTINMVYTSILSTSSIVCPRQPLGGDPNDFEAVLDYSIKGITKKVAFFSMGDFAYEVFHAMSFYEGMGCDVLVCACNNRFNIPIKRLNDRYNGIHPPVYKTVSTSSANQQADNSRDANIIIQLI